MFKLIFVPLIRCLELLCRITPPDVEGFAFRTVRIFCNLDWASAATADTSTEHNVRKHGLGAPKVAVSYVLQPSHELHWLALKSDLLQLTFFTRRGRLHKREPATAACATSRTRIDIIEVE